MNQKLREKVVANIQGSMSDIDLRSSRVGGEW